MSKPADPESRSPADQAGEENGKIKSPQRSERDMHDTARGSEPETRGTSGPRS